MKSGINDGDNDDDDMDNKEGRNGGKKRGDNNDDSSASMGSNSSTSLSDEVVTWVLFNLSYVNLLLYNLKYSKLFLITYNLFLHWFTELVMQLKTIQGDCVCLSTNCIFEFVSSHHTLLQLNIALRWLLMLLLGESLCILSYAKFDTYDLFVSKLLF